MEYGWQRNSGNRSPLGGPGFSRSIGARICCIRPWEEAFLPNLLRGSMRGYKKKIQTLNITRTYTVNTSIWLKSWIFASPQHTFWYFWGLPRGPAGVGGRSTPSESAQGVYEMLLDKIQNLKISRTCSVSASIWLKSSFNGCTFCTFWGTFGVLSRAPTGFMEGALLLNRFRGSMWECEK